MSKIARRSTASIVLLILACHAWVLASPLRHPAPYVVTQPFTVLSLKHESAGPVTRILIESDAPPLYTVTRQSPTLVVIDLPAEASLLAPVYAVKSAAVDAVSVRNTASKSAPGRARTSIEIAVREGVTDASKVSGNTLVVELTTAQGAPRAEATTQPGVYVEPAPLSARR